MLGEHLNCLILGSLGGTDRKRSRILAKVERILDDVEAETLLVEAAVGEASQEGMLENLLEDALDLAPQLVWKVVGHVIPFSTVGSSKDSDLPLSTSRHPLFEKRPQRSLRNPLTKDSFDP
jgi:hypothetical protein